MTSQRPYMPATPSVPVPGGGITGSNRGRDNLVLVEADPRCVDPEAVASALARRIQVEGASPPLKSGTQSITILRPPKLKTCVGACRVQAHVIARALTPPTASAFEAVLAVVAWAALPAVAAFAALAALSALSRSDLRERRLVDVRTLDVLLRNVRAGHLTVADVLVRMVLFLISRLSMKPWPRRRTPAERGE